MELTLKDIKTAVEAHLEVGWRAVFVYDGMDAWIDYGRVDLEKEGLKLCFEWTNWDEGEISGHDALIEDIKQTFHLESPQVRCSRI